MDYIPQRKGSGDSLASQRSFDSQHSSDSHSSPTIRESKHDKSVLKKQEQWSSTSTRSETDSENGVSSAPPVVGERFNTYSEEDIWCRRTDIKDNSKNLRPHVTVKRETRYVNDNPTIRSTTEGLRSLPPVRRQARDNNEFALCTPKIHHSDSDQFKEYFSFDRAPNKAVEILGKPEVPMRNLRKPKRGQVKSLGEEVTDCVSVDKNLLGTIDESLVVHPEHLGKQHRLSPRDKDSSAKLLSSETDWSSGIKQSLTPKRQRSAFGTLDLRRRNSDPATKVSLVSEHPSSIETSPQPLGLDIEWQKHGMFSIAGHKFRKINRFTKDDLCTMCDKEMDPFITQGYKCIDCKQTFHTKCIQNKSVLQKPCVQNTSATDSSKPNRRKYRKHSRAPYDLNKQQVATKFSLTGTSEFTDRTDKIISDARELQAMQDFITSKICKIEHEAGQNTSEVDRMFKQALREFKDNLVQFHSIANKNGFEAYSIKYKDLITNFMQAMETVCQREQKDKDFPVTMGVNAFRGFMDEFMSSRAEAEKPKAKRKKDKKRKSEDPIKYAGHTFVLTIINIPTACEICSSFFMWPIERGLVCQSCKLTCHKKCYQAKTIGYCMKCASVTSHEDSNKLFGVPLSALLTEEGTIPVVIERLLATIEITGLYAEGIYRKSGVSSKVKELKAKMEENQEKINFESYQVHVLASVLKSFLREMPEPLLTFECYENFITAANMTDPQDRVSTLYDILKKLPKPNYDLMERLIFHLARIALHERTNRMSAASLAIVFAPCILRTNKVVPAQDCLHDIGSQTRCIETIITEQMRKIRITLDDIDTLDTARQAATNRLSSLRSSKVFSPDELLPSNQSQQPHVEDEENLLVDHIQEIQKEKEHLTSTLPILTHATSDDDMLSTDGDGSLDDISCVGEHKKVRGPIVRSVSGGDSRQSFPKLKRQSSSDISVTVVDECEDTPIMV